MFDLASFTLPAISMVLMKRRKENENLESYVWRLTEYEGIQASVRHVLIEQHLLESVDIIAQKSNKISMLKFGDQYNFIFKF